MGAFGDSYWEDHPQVYHNENGVAVTQISGVEVSLKDYFGERTESDSDLPKKSQWTAYRNLAKGAVYIGGSEADYKDTTDKSKALMFGTKDQVKDYVKDFNDIYKKHGEPIWMPIEL